MKCEYCDSHIQNMPDNGICPNCGARVVIFTENEKGFDEERFLPKPPIGVYRFSDGYIQFGAFGIRIYRKVLGQVKKDYSVPYNQIAVVSFVVGKPLKPGFLCIRSKQDKHIPCPTTFRESLDDFGTASVHISNNEVFHRLYLFLKECADIVNSTEK